MQKLIDVLIRSRIVLVANLNDLSRFLPESQGLYDMTNSQIKELETTINEATAEQRFAPDLERRAIKFNAEN